MNAIYPKFQTLETEKQERILNAAMKEFAKHGYERASTNEIIKEAGISKGSLFCYFKSKKELYLFLLGHIVKVLEQIYNGMDLRETDIFERIKGVGFLKSQVMRTHPQAFNFLKAVTSEKAVEVKDQIIKTEKLINKSAFTSIYQNIDLTKFRDDIDITKTMDIINWTMLGFSEQEWTKTEPFEQINDKQLNEWDSYSDIMKRCFYK